MLIRLLFNNSLFFSIFLIIVGCSPKLKTLQDDRIPSGVADYYSKVSYDSLTTKSLIFRDEMNTSYLLKANIRKGQVVGTLQVKKGLGDMPNVPVPEQDKFQEYRVQLKFLFCCSNHMPRDCVRTEKAMKDSTATKKCSNWYVAIK